MKRTVSVLLIILTVIATLSVCSVNTYAATSGKTGSCQWSLSGSVLTISGNGAMGDGDEVNNWDRNITEVIIKEGVTEIGKMAFYDCTELKKVTLPSTLKTIGYFAFGSCRTLPEIKLPENLTTIEYYAFDNCDSLREITIPKKVNYIDADAFEYCNVMENIFVDPANTKYTSVDGVLFNKNKTVIVKYPCGKQDKSHYDIPEGVTEIGASAFCNAAWLDSVSIPDSVVTIRRNAFSLTAMEREGTVDGVVYIGKHLVKADDNNISECTVREGTVSISENAFCYCEKLKSITIPESMAFIGESAFEGCARLKEIYLPAAIKTIEKSAFFDCKSLKKVYYGGSAKDFAKISMGDRNDPLKQATKKYNCCLGGADHMLGEAVVAKEATCTVRGTLEEQCSVCGVVMSSSIPATGHNFGEMVTVLKETCTEKGRKEQKCAVCGFVNAAEIAAIGHSFGEWSLALKETCTEQGEEQRSCANCGEVEKKPIEAIGHKYCAPFVVTEPTYYKAGATHSVCENCGDIIEDAIPSLKEQGRGVSPVLLIGGGVLLVAAVVVVIIAVKKKKK